MNKKVINIENFVRFECKFTIVLLSIALIFCQGCVSSNIDENMYTYDHFYENARMEDFEVTFAFTDGGAARVPNQYLIVKATITNIGNTNYTQMGMKENPIFGITVYCETEEGEYALEFAEIPTDFAASSAKPQEYTFEVGDTYTYTERLWIPMTAPRTTYHIRVSTRAGVFEFSDAFEVLEFSEDK